MREDEKTIRYAVLNVVATPHPENIYRQIMEAAEKYQISYRRDHFARIGKAEEVEPGFLQGGLFIWTEIDTDEPAIDKRTLSEIDLNSRGIQIPGNIGFNSRIFLWTFRLENHRLVVELNNELEKTISPNVAAKIFSKIFRAVSGEENQPNIEVTLVPQDDVIDRLLAIPGLKKLQIHLKRPNPDDMSSETARILEELEEQGAKSQDISLTAIAGKTLQPNAKTVVQALVASFNGWVSARGYSDGVRLVRSTREYPKVIEMLSSKFGSWKAAALAAAKELIGDRI